MPETEKALDKIDIQSELKTLSPIEKRSLELRKAAEEIEITDKASYQEAKKVKRELVSHRTATKDLRLTFTRKLDNLKDQFIKKQDEVLEPSIAGEDVIKSKIAEWEKAEAERKEAEEKRIADMVAKIVAIPQGLDVQTASLEDVKRLRAALKMERGLLEPNDRNRVAVKNATEEVTRKLDSADEFITARIEQERIAEEQRKEQERLDAERKKLEEEQAAAAKAKEEAAKASAPEPTPTPVTEPAKESSEPVKTSEGSNPAPVPKKELEPETATWELVTHGRHDPSEAELKKIAAKILDGYNIGDYIVEEPAEEE